MALKVRPVIQSEINANLADASNITAIEHREVISDVNDSVFNKLSDTSTDITHGATTVGVAITSLDARVTTIETVPPAPGFISHNDLSSLSSDDHPQYLTNSRGDARYPSLANFNSHTGNTTIHVASNVMQVASFSNSGGFDVNALASNNVIPWDVELIKDPPFTHSNVTLNSTVTVSETAPYHIFGSIVIAAGVNKKFSGFVKIRKNGSVINPGRAGGGYIRDDTSVFQTVLNFSFIMKLNAGEYIEVLVDRASVDIGAMPTVANYSLLNMLKLKL